MQNHDSRFPQKTIFTFGAKPATMSPTFCFCQPSPSVDKVFPHCYNQIIIHFECRRACSGLAENRKSGANPERYRHCMCTGPTRGESQPLGNFPRRLCAGCQSTSQETCSRSFPLLSAYIGQADFFVRENRLRQCSYCRSFLLKNTQKQRRCPKQAALSFSYFPHQNSGA